MSFLAILVALLLEQVRPLARGNPIHGVLRSWARWADSNFDAGRTQHGWLAWAIAVLLPTLGVLAAHWLLVYFAGWPFAVVWNIVVLYITLGFRQFSHHFTHIRDALESGDEARARQLLAEWQQVDAVGLPRAEVLRQVIEYSVVAAHRHVFGVLGWFSVLAAVGLGPAGAVFYRMSEFVPRYWVHRGNVQAHPVSAALRHVSLQAWRAVDWVPARLTAMAFAVVGSFEDAVESWRGYARTAQDHNDGIILAATAGALNLRLGWRARPDDMSPEWEQDEAPSGQGEAIEVGHLRTVVGLVWRTVVLWMVLLALLTLARLLG